MKDFDDQVKMDNQTKSETESSLKKYGIYAAVIVIVFLIGFVPMWIRANNYEKQRDAAIAALRPSVLQNNLATAAINVRRGEFEQARRQTSDFFTDLRGELQNENGAFNQQQREAVNQILAQRDDTITLLARNDAAAGDRLSDLYFAYMQMKNSAQIDKK